MDKEVLTFINMFSVYFYLQSNSLKKLPANIQSKLHNLNQQQLKAVINVKIREFNQLPPLSLGELAECLGMKKASTSLLVSDLVDKKFLCRTVDEKNRRYIKIKCGLKSKKIGDSLFKFASKPIKEILGNLTAKEREYFLKASEKIFNLYLDKIGKEKWKR